VQQQLGDGVVRTIALGFERRPASWHECEKHRRADFSAIGKGTLGRIMNVLGSPIDEAGPVKTEAKRAIHQRAPSFEELSPSQELLETGIKVIDLICPFAKAERLVCSAALASARL